MNRTDLISVPTGRFQVAGAILAGGQATRMGGRPKSFLEIEGKRIIDRQLDVLRPLFAELLLGANDAPLYAELGLPTVPDAIRGVGPLAGVLAVLEAARASHVFVVACDMPWITEAAVRLIAGGSPEADVVVPVVDGRPDPLFARYSRACAAAIRRRLEAGDRKVTSFFADVAVRPIAEDQLRALDPDLRFLANCNTPGDLV